MGDRKLIRHCCLWVCCLPRGACERLPCARSPRWIGLACMAACEGPLPQVISPPAPTVLGLNDNLVASSCQHLVPGESGRLSFPYKADFTRCLSLPFRTSKPPCSSHLHILASRTCTEAQQACHLPLCAVCHVCTYPCLVTLASSSDVSRCRLGEVTSISRHKYIQGCRRTVSLRSVW